MPRCRVAMADVDRPPDTSALIPCGDGETAAAIEAVRARLVKRQRVLAELRAHAQQIDRVLASLRRLSNPHLRAYRRGDAGLLLSEPFNRVGSAPPRADLAHAATALRAMFGAPPPARIVGALAAFGEHALGAAVRAGIRIAVVPEGKRYADFSPAVARLVPEIDRWPAPPSGLFVVEERRVLLRPRALAMTAAHEFAHALDCVLARKPRSYFSYEDDELRGCYAAATGFVNEYAASGLDEYFAESVRAYLEINDARCAWLPLTRHDLFVRDPRLYALVERLFASGFRRSRG